MSLLSLLVTLLVLCLVFALLYWIVVLVSGALPLPIKTPVTVILFVLLALIAIGCLLDLVGLFGPQRHLLIHL